MSGFDRGLDAPVGPAGVAHGGKAASSMARNRVAARAVTSVSGSVSMKRTLTSLWMAWTWQSISPGIKVRLPQSITRCFRRVDRRLAEFPDRVAFDQQLISATQFAERRLEQFEIPEQDLL